MLEVLGWEKLRCDVTGDVTRCNCCGGILEDGSDILFRTVTTTCVSPSRYGQRFMSYILRLEVHPLRSAGGFGGLKEYIAVHSRRQEHPPGKASRR